MRSRKAKPEDAEEIWSVMEGVIREGNTYTFSPEARKEEMLDYWLHPSHHVYVAVIEESVLGTYMLKDNQPALGAHVANGSYMVAKAARGQGVGRAMGEHSLREAPLLGYRAIQFNIVVATNTAAVKLWESLGFKIIGTIPEAFQHTSLGLVDAHIMYQKVKTVAPGAGRGSQSHCHFHKTQTSRQKNEPAILWRLRDFFHIK